MASSAKKLKQFYRSHHSLIHRYSHSVTQHLREGVDSQVRWWRIRILLVGAAATATDPLSIYPFTGVPLAFPPFFWFYFFFFIFIFFYFFISYFFLTSILLIFKLFIYFFFFFLSFFLSFLFFYFLSSPSFFLFIFYFFYSLSLLFNSLSSEYAHSCNVYRK